MTGRQSSPPERSLALECRQAERVGDEFPESAPAPGNFEPAPISSHQTLAPARSPIRGNKNLITPRQAERDEAVNHFLLMQIRAEILGHCPWPGDRRRPRGNLLHPGNRKYLRRNRHPSCSTRILAPPCGSASSGVRHGARQLLDNREYYETQYRSQSIAGECRLSDLYSAARPGVPKELARRGGSLAKWFPRTKRRRCGSTVFRSSPSRKPSGNRPLRGCRPGTPRESSPR